MPWRAPQGLEVVAPLYLYAITDRAGLPADGGSGIEGAPLLTVPYREIVAVVSAVTEARVEATPANVWLHEEVVEALMAVCPVLPVRWGTVLPDERRLFAVMEEHHDGFVAALRLLLTGPWPPYHFVAGCVPAEALPVERLPAARHGARWQGGRWE